MSRLRTWHLEAAFVAGVLLVVLIATNGGPVEVVGSLAVFASFGHAQVSDRLAESQATMHQPTVDCWRMARRYFVIKEACWLAYFMAHRTWAALVGVGVFLLYPAWRWFWRNRAPALICRLTSHVWIKRRGVFYLVLVCERCHGSRVVRYGGERE